VLGASRFGIAWERTSESGASVLFLYCAYLRVDFADDVADLGEYDRSTVDEALLHSSNWPVVTDVRFLHAFAEGLPVTGGLYVAGGANGGFLPGRRFVNHAPLTKCFALPSVRAGYKPTAPSAPELNLRIIHRQENGLQKAAKCP
jgi:hypothetical protein